MNLPPRPIAVTLTMLQTVAPQALAAGPHVAHRHVQHGLLRPRGDHHPGQGHPRDWTYADLRAAAFSEQLMDAGRITMATAGWFAAYAEVYDVIHDTGAGVDLPAFVVIDTVSRAVHAAHTVRKACKAADHVANRLGHQAMVVKLADIDRTIWTRLLLSGHVTPADVPTGLQALNNGSESTGAILGVLTAEGGE